MNGHDDGTDARLRAALNSGPERFETPSPDLRDRVMARIEALPQRPRRRMSWGGAPAVAACLVMAGLLVLLVPTDSRTEAEPGLAVVGVLSQEIEARAARAPAQLRTRISEIVVEPVRDDVLAVQGQARRVAASTERALRVFGAIARLGERSSG